MSVLEHSEATRLEVALRVAEIWSKVLGRPIADDQSHSYFYALGGDRVLTGKVLSEINRSFGLRITEGNL